MCGIAGFAGPEAIGSVDVADAMLKVLRHRGPDASGIFARGRGLVGQARLSIIDLVTGDPPIENEDGTVGAALNGEIYNFRRLRDELRAEGHQLTTAGDAEVLVHLAETLDARPLAARLDGMFAFAIWDARRERLLLGRDRFGKKPLYYWAGGGRIVFGSEIKALLVHPDVPARLDEDVLPAFLVLGYAPTPRTFYDGIRSLPPGHVLEWSPGREPEITPYWEPPGLCGALEPESIGFADAAGRTRALLTSAVRRRLVSDVPLGAFLSGGIDSSAVVALMSLLTDEPVKTFTIGFEDDDGFDERPYARMVAQRYNTDHTEFVVKPDAAGLIERLVFHHDQPFGDSSALPTYLLSELTAGHVTVALCGDGGDELFAGYERLAAALAVSRLQVVPGAAVRTATAAMDALPDAVFGGRASSVRRFARRAAQSPPMALLSWISYADPELAQALLPGGSRWAIEEYERLYERAAGGPLERLVAVNLRTYLLDDLLPKVDRMAMAHGLEVRSPFLDTALADFALRLPGSHKVRGMSLKRVLRRAMRDLLPDEILHRKKHGFGIPLDRWLRTDLQPYVDSMLGAPGSRVRARLQPGALDDVLRSHACAAVSHGHLIWALLTLEVFLRDRDW